MSEGKTKLKQRKLGCKIYHGPYVYNFEEIYDLLKTYQITEKITNSDELSKKINLI